MEPVVLTDKFVRPDQELLKVIIGKKIIFWDEIISYLNDNYKDITEEWKFYNDGKCWLFRTLKKKKTIFWVGVIAGTFRVTFYLGDQAEPLVLNGDLSERIKEEFANAKPYKIGRALTITMSGAADVEEVKKLVGIKLVLLK